jgi:uncharacterized YigZ family protein
MRYFSVLEESITEYTVQKSRFITYIKPVIDEEVAKEFIEAIRKKHWDASHNVPIYLIGEKMKIQRFSDDGEPSGTAGMPVLDMLKKEGVTNIVMVITRYFGGIKLGKGGLVRAYTHSAKLGLDSSKVIAYEMLDCYHIRYDYSLHGKVENHIRQDQHIFECETIFEENIMKEIMIPTGKEELLEPFVELSSNQMIIEKVSSGYYCLDGDKIIGGSNERTD